MCPRNGEFPSFSDLDCVHHAPIILNEIPAQDLKDLKLLLFVLWFLPTPFMRIFLMCLEKMKDMNGELGTLIRMLQFGLRGIAFALYYSDMRGPNAVTQTTPVKVVGFSIMVRKEA